MNEKEKEIYKENLTYSAYGVAVLLVVFVLFGMGDWDFSIIIQFTILILFLGGLRGFFLIQKLKK